MLENHVQALPAVHMPHCCHIVIITAAKLCDSAIFVLPLIQEVWVQILFL